MPGRATFLMHTVYGHHTLPLMPFRHVLVPSLLALACLVPAAELGWSGAPGAKPPPGWTVTAAADAGISFLERAIEISALPGRQALAVAAVELADGSDERPMRLSAVVSAWGKGALETYPALVALEWGGGAIFAVGLGFDPHSKRDERRAWAVWSGNGVAGTDHAEVELAGGASPAHLRIVLTSREVVAYGSRDGFAWSRVAGVLRERLGATGAPARVVVGRGQTRSGAAGLAADPPGLAKGKPCTYRFADLRVEAGPPEVPSAALRTYAKKDSLADTLDAFAAAGMPRRWRLHGPDDARTTEIPGELPAAFTAGEGWKEHVLGETERFLQLGKLMPAAGYQVRWAATEVDAGEAGWVRFRFDGMPQCWLWVDGRLASSAEPATREAEADRLSASVWLSAGKHQVVLATRTHEGRTAATLRWESGDPRARIALLRRLAIDFAGDEQLIDAPFEMARLWEGLGFAREAVAALAEVAAGDPEQAERALAERARLFHQLGDEAAATTETTALQKLWEAGAVDPVTAARRTARLWQRLDVPERAAGILGEALKLPGVDRQDRCALVVERARLRRTVGDEAGVAAELRAAAEHLPAGDAVRFDLLCSAARIDPAMPQPALEALTAQATDALRARQLAGVHAARKDEIARIAARRAAAIMPGTPLAMPAIELAEDLAAAKDESGALKLYQIELTRRGLPAAKDLAAARTALVRAVLAETPAGATLLAEAAVVPQDAVGLVQWQVRGPVPQGDWTPHEKPAFDLTQAPTGKEWKAVQPSLWNAGVLDFGQLGGGDGVVWYMATTIASDKARSITASFGADDALSVWLNGARLYSDRVQRGLVPDSIVLSLPLKQGANVLVCSVQNGGGAAGFQFRTRREPWPASDVASALAGAASDRAGAAQTLAELSGALLAADRLDEAWALARTAIACWPERLDLVRDLAGRVLTQPAWKPSPSTLLELVAWFDANLADRRWDDTGTRIHMRDNVPTQLLEAGLVDEAMARLRRTVLTELEPIVVAGAHLREADIWQAMGYPRRAAISIEHARDAAPGEDAIDSAADRRRRVIRLRKGDQVSIAAPFELTTLLRTAERALGGDPERAAKDFQQVIESSGDQPIQLADGRLRGAAMFAAGRLRSSGGPALQAWIESNGDRAAGALARADASDPQALSQVSGRWPLAPAAGEALRREAALWSARGAWQLARGTALRCLAEHPGDDHLLLLRAAHAAARSGDSVSLDGLLARLAKAGRPLPWDGRTVPPEQIAGVLRGLLPPAVAIEPAPASLIVQLPAYAQTMRPETVADARPPTPAAALCGGLLVVATPSELAGVAADGTLRWSMTAAATAGVGTPRLASAGEASLAADAGMVVVGLHRAGTRRLVAVEATTGRQLWSSATIQSLAAATLASAPTLSGGRVWAWFIEASRGFVACLDARDGTVLWRSTLATGAVRQPLTNAGDVFAAGNAPAPALSGRELFVSTDAGQIGAFDAIDGRLLWLHAYPRTAIDVHSAKTALRRLMARGRGAILADAARVYVAPRDGLGIIAIDRAGGALAWASELADVHELCALTPAGLVAIGPAVTLHHPANGALRLRWRPSSGERPGRPAVIGDVAWIPLRHGPLRLSLADGGIRQGPAWSALGIAGQTPGALQAEDGRLLALADGLVVLTGAGAGKPVTVEVAPRIEASVQQQAVAGDAAPTALAMRWDLPIGRIETLYRPVDARDGEIYAVAAGRLYRLDAATGRIAWSVPTLCSPRGISCDGSALLVRSDGQLAILDRATGRLRHAEPISRDPLPSSQAWDSWRAQYRLVGGMLARWYVGDGWFTLRRSEDGRSVHNGRCEGSIQGIHIAGDELQILVSRGNAIIMELRRLADGVRINEVPVGLPGEQASMLRLPDGGLVIGNNHGGLLWNPTSHEMVRFDLGMEWVHTAWRDGEVLNLVGVKQGKHRSTFLDPAGKLIAQDEFIAWGEWPERLPLASRWIAGQRVQVAWRGGKTGYLIRRADGAEQAWLPVREEWRRNQYGLIPFESKAISFASDKDGLLRSLIIDPKAGKIEVESTLGLTMTGHILPQAAAGGVVVPTTRGLVSIVPVAGPAKPLPGRAQAETHEAVWRMAKPLELDGRLDEWGDQAELEQPASDGGHGLSARVAWRDDAMVMAISIPRPPAQTGATLIAIEPMRGEFDWDAPPLQLTLSWQGGAARTQVVSSPMPEDATRAAIQARAASDGAALTWEVVVPWGWMYPTGERPGRDHWLRWDAMTSLPGGSSAGLEVGGGLGRGLDKSGFIRLCLAETKPAPDAAAPTRPKKK